MPRLRSPLMTRPKLIVDTTSMPQENPSLSYASPTNLTALLVLWRCCGIQTRQFPSLDDQPTVRTMIC